MYLIVKNWSDGSKTAEWGDDHNAYEAIELANLCGEFTVEVWEEIVENKLLKRRDNSEFVPTTPLNLCGDADFYDGRD